MNVDDQFIFMINRASRKVFYYQQQTLIRLIWIALVVSHTVLNHLIIYFSFIPSLSTRLISYQTQFQHLSIFHLNPFRQSGNLKSMIESPFLIPFLILIMNYILFPFTNNFILVNQFNFLDCSKFIVNFPLIQLSLLKQI